VPAHGLKGKAKSLDDASDASSSHDLLPWYVEISY